MRRSSMVFASTALFIFAIGGCADEDADEGTVEDDPMSAVAPEDVGVETMDPGTERTQTSCSSAKPYTRCNVFGHCRCSAYP